MNKRFSTIWRFLLPIVILLIIAPIVFVQIASQFEGAGQVSANNVLIVAAAGALLGLLLVFVIFHQLKNVIMKPIGADPDVVVDVMQRISSGNLEDDQTLTADPDTLLDNVLTMRATLKKTFEQLQENGKRLSLSASVFNHAHDGIFITAADFRILDVNGSFTKITGYIKEAVIHQKPAELGFSFQDNEYFDKAIIDIKERDNCRGEVWNLHSDGNVYAAWLDIFAVYDDEGEVANYIGLFSDITDVKNQQQALEHMAYHDPLTQLPNRILFSEQLDAELIKNNAANQEMLAICYFDLDGFKPVNDALGHDAGDKLLVALSSRVRNSLRDGDTIARLGGDEFAMLLSGLKSKEACEKKLDELLEVIKQPYDIAGDAVNVSASIGYTLYPCDFSEPDTLLRHADHAMYHVKVNGRGFHHQFDPEHDKEMLDVQKERDAINEALPNGEFSLFYQPKVDMRLGRVIGVEALIRWNHPARGVVSPAEFLPMIEQDDEFTVQIGEWVISETLRQVKTWAANDIALKVSVNISARHMMQSNFAKRLEQLLAQYSEVSPTLLELEITETALIDDVSSIAKTIEKCKKHGVTFVLDDFGVGNSSLTYLRRLPVEAVKIDQSFIRDMMVNKDDLAVVSCVISLSKSFDLGVIAEGLESAEHGLKLMELGCYVAQGYGISQPLPAEEVAAWVKSYVPDPSWQTEKIITPMSEELIIS
jgi:diguanylate cyclase (GGDEF)-like protein/PAS domain S-box-containing protein